MRKYEIHIVPKGAEGRTYPCLQLNDHAAVRRAQAMAKDFESVEVWREETCVYARPAEAAVHANV